MPYLNDTGLTYFWKKLKDKFAPKNHTHAGSITEAARTTVNVPATGWTTRSDGLVEKSVSVSGLKTTDDVDIEVAGDQADAVVLLGGRVDTAGALIVVVPEVPTTAFDLLVAVRRKV